MSDYQPQVGDRVRVVLEGEVVTTSGSGGRFVIKSQAPFFPHIIHSNAAVSVEKIEPPVEHFGPGDVVRNSFATYVLAHDGYTTLSRPGNVVHGRFFSFGTGKSLDHFNSSNGYTRVPLGGAS